jgi:hypothetical protein
MAPPSDPDFDPENGPEQYLDQDDVSSLKDSYRIQSFRGRVSSLLDVTADVRRGLHVVAPQRTPTVGSNSSRNSRHSLRAIPLRVIRRGI